MVGATSAILFRPVRRQSTQVGGVIKIESRMAGGDEVVVHVVQGRLVGCRSTTWQPAQVSARTAGSDRLVISPRSNLARCPAPPANPACSGLPRAGIAVTRLAVHTFRMQRIEPGGPVSDSHDRRDNEHPSGRRAAMCQSGSTSFRSAWKGHCPGHRMPANGGRSISKRSRWIASDSNPRHSKRIVTRCRRRPRRGRPSPSSRRSL